MFVTEHTFPRDADGTLQGDQHFGSRPRNPLGPPEPHGAGRPAPRPSGSVQPPAEGTGGASGAAAPFGEEGVSAGGSGSGGA